MCSTTKVSLWLGVLALSLLPIRSLLAYEGEAVKDGGTISGSVRFKGTPPVPKTLDITKDKNVCGKTVQTDPSLIVSSGNVVNAVVWIRCAD